jgi:NADH-quinone oxidoreductase subunit N
MMLFGMSLVYGATATLDFDSLAAQMASYADEAGGGALVPPMLVVGLVMLIIGLCFKVAAVPFHMWAPDVYEGAPTPVTAFFASAPKIAAFGLLARLLLQPFADLLPQWQQVIVLASLASMVVGALAALRQTNIKRLLAYSSIGHAGFILMGLAAGTDEGAQGLLIYLAVYLFTTIGAWACVLLMRRKGEYVEQIADLSGLSRTRPWLAFALAACMFSMAGIPPLAGFFGKLYVILPAIQAGLVPLAVAGLLTSVISCYYYLRVVKFMYFDEPAEELDRGAALPLNIGLAFSVAAISLFFLIPTPLLAHARAAASLLSQ